MRIHMACAQLRADRMGGCFDLVVIINQQSSCVKRVAFTKCSGRACVTSSACICCNCVCIQSTASASSRPKLNASARLPLVGASGGLQYESMLLRCHTIGGAAGALPSFLGVDVRTVAAERGVDAGGGLLQLQRSTDV